MGGIGMHSNPREQDFSIQDAMRLAQTPTGKQLIALLRTTGGKDFQDAMTKAAAGDYAQAKTLITAMLSSAEAQKLLEQLGR